MTYRLTNSSVFFRMELLISRPFKHNCAEVTNDLIRVSDKFIFPSIYFVSFYFLKKCVKSFTVDALTIVYVYESGHLGLLF